MGTDSGVGVSLPPLVAWLMTTIAKTRHIDVRALLDVRAVFRAGRRV